MSAQQHIDFGILLNIAFATFKRRLHAHLGEKGFGDVGSSFGYVFRMLGSAPQNLSQVAQGLGITSQGALKVINDMVAKGYVERFDDPDDGRSKRLALTPRARALMAEAQRFHDAFECKLADTCGKEEVAAMRAVLETIYAEAGAAGEPQIQPC